MIDKSMDFVFGRGTNLVLSVLDWWYDRDIRSRRKHPAGLDRP